uniref:Uncharacterized protein n=2 Tax=Panagrolaimus superbus TaxID=310955 RepID=A0A914YNE8_9BILA
MSRRCGIIAFTAFIGFLTLFCIIYEYNLNFEEVLKYILISTAVITVLTVAITVCYILSSQIQIMIENKNGDNFQTYDTTSLGNYSLRSMNFRSNIAVIQMMERLSQFSDCSVKPLPTYTKAMDSSFPFNPSPEFVVCTPPPPYTVIEMPVDSTALMPECLPPPNYDNIIITTDNNETDNELPVYSASLPRTLDSNSISNFNTI